jgi:two-component sensor histidine kinase
MNLATRGAAFMLMILKMVSIIGEPETWRGQGGKDSYRQYKPVGVKSTGPHIEVRVSDSRPGVSADYLDPASEGIGMQIVTAIVGQHEGEFLLEDPDSSTFLVRLP